MLSLGTAKFISCILLDVLICFDPIFTKNDENRLISLLNSYVYTTNTQTHCCLSSSF